MTPPWGGQRCCRRNACSRRGAGIRVSLKFLAFCNSGTQMLTGLRLGNSVLNVCVCGEVSGDVVGEEAGRAVLVAGAPQTSAGETWATSDQVSVGEPPRF